MRTLHWFLLILWTTLFFAQAQQQPVIYKTQDLRSYSQFSFYLGYDQPLSGIDAKYIEYKGNIVTGISFHNFWDWIGLQADINLSYTNQDSSFRLPMAYYNDFYETESTMSRYEAYNDNLSKLFLGAGPAFKYQTQNNKFVIDLGLMAGLGIVQRGSYVQYGLDDVIQGYGLAVNYHSGFGNQSLLALKGNLRFNYFFKPDFGLFLGTYYINYLNAEEADNNDLLVEYNFQNVNDTYYYFEPVYTSGNEPVNGITDYYVDSKQRNATLDNRKSFDLSSMGIVGGVTWKINRSSSSVRCPNGYYQCPQDQLCYTDDNCGKVNENNIKVTVVDDLSGKPMPNVSVELIRDEDQKTLFSESTTSAGNVLFNKVNNSNYTVEGKITPEVSTSFDNENITSIEFNNTGTVEKTLHYNDPQFLVSGQATDCLSHAQLANSTLQFVDTQTLQTYTAKANVNGQYSLSLPKANYEIEIKDAGYFSERKNLNLLQLDRTQSPYAIIDVCAQQLDCNNQIKFKNLLFNLDDYHITPNSTQELDNLAEYLQANPKVKLEIYAFTDSRGSAAYNLRLSQQRANETVKYLETKGISASRLIAKGYGETDLLNQCSDGVQCTEAEHAINRRTEFKVVCE